MIDRDRQKLEQELIESERKYKLIAEHTNDVIWIIDIKTFKLKYISPSVFQLRGITIEEALNESLEQTFSGDSFQKAMDQIAIALENSKNNQSSDIFDEYKLQCKDGSVIDVEISASIIKDETGNPTEMLGVSRDITRRKIAENSLKESQDQLIRLLARQTKKSKKLTRDLKYVFEHTTNAIAFFEIVDSQILFSLCNNRWANALGFDSKKIIGMNIDQIGDDATTTLYRKYINWAVSENKPIEDVTLWKDKELQIAVIPLKDDYEIVSGCAAFVTDITDKQHAVQEMRNLEKQITYTGIEVETRERRKLASDLHDNVGPLLSSMNMYLSSLSRKPEIQMYSGILDDIRRILKETISSVREISNNISPQVLNSYGLTAALNLFFETKKNLITIHIDNNMDDFRFSETKETMLYNIIKEAFNNSIKYANATCIDLSIKKNENLITVIYKDNGIGFNLKEKMASASQNLGLFSIINRIKNLDGIYEIKTSEGKGFMLEVNFLTNL